MVLLLELVQISTQCIKLLPQMTFSQSLVKEAVEPRCAIKVVTSSLLVNQQEGKSLSHKIKEVINVINNKTTIKDSFKPKLRRRGPRKRQTKMLRCDSMYFRRPK